MKVRDLQKSHNFRESVKKWGPPVRRHRIYEAAPINSAREKHVELTSTDDSANAEEIAVQLAHGSLYNINHQIEQKKKEHERLKSWISERKAMRKDLNSIGFNASWYDNKTNKTECESRVFQKLNTANDKREAMSPGKKKKKERRISQNHADMLPLLNSPLPIALAIIADYLQTKRMRLIDLYRTVDKNKDWMMSRSELKGALRGAGIPLTEASLDELIISLDINNDDMLSYKELAWGIDIYQKDRRWQKLKKMYDQLMEDKEDESLGSASDQRGSKHYLRLPHIESPENVAELMLQRSREKHRRKQQEIKEKQRLKKKELGMYKKLEETSVTLTGALRDCKLEFLQFMDDECNRCIDLLHSSGLNVSSEHVRAALLPPKDNPMKLCQALLGFDRSVFPKDHAECELFRKEQKKALRGLRPTVLPPSGTSTRGSMRKGQRETPLPRVAHLDFKNRAEEAKEARIKRRSVSPTPCWPQHLLDKLRLCMDDTGEKDGRQILFNRVSK